MVVVMKRGETVAGRSSRMVVVVGRQPRVHSHQQPAWAPEGHGDGSQNHHQPARRCPDDLGVSRTGRACR